MYFIHVFISHVFMGLDTPKTWASWCKIKDRTTVTGMQTYICKCVLHVLTLKLKQAKKHKKREGVC